MRAAPTLMLCLMLCLILGGCKPPKPVKPKLVILRGTVVATMLSATDIDVLAVKTAQGVMKVWIVNKGRALPETTVHLRTARTLDDLFGKRVAIRGLQYKDYIVATFLREL